MTLARSSIVHDPRRIRRALLATIAALGLMVVAGAPGATSTVRADAGAGLKAVIIVGPTGSLTSYYKQSADAVAAAAAANGMSVTKLYTPNATWAKVKAATAGANLVYFAGHGNGWPSPYFPSCKSYAPCYPDRQDGYGLDPSSNGDTPTYYGEQYVSQVKLAPGAIVLLNHLCYAPGASEPGNPVPSQSVAVQRADDFAAGFLAAGASVVIASDGSGFPSFINGLFSDPGSTTMDQLFMANGDFSGASDAYFNSVRTSGARIHLDPQASTLKYTHAVTGDLNQTAGAWRQGTGRQPAPSCPTPTQMPALAAGDTTFIPLGPTRILDTRNGTGLSNPFMAGQARTLQVAGQDGVPADAVAVTVNVTTVDQTDAGYVSLTPSPADCPATSTLNFPTGDVRANGATVPLDADGALSATYMGPWTDSSTDLVMDVTGAFVPSGGDVYAPLGPTRLLDSRVGVGLAGTFKSGLARTLKVAGTKGVPSNATAVTVNLTVVNQTAAGYLSLTTTPTDAPTTSTLNFPRADIRANGAIVPLDGKGQLSITYMSGPGATTDVVMDVTGAFTPATGTKFTPVAPARLLDTRSAVGLSGAFTAGVARKLQVSGHGGVPTGAKSVTLNITVVGQTAGGYLSLTAKPTDAPVTSIVNFPPKDIRANGATVPLAADGSLGITFMAAPGATTQVVIDVTGYSD